MTRFAVVGHVEWIEFARFSHVPAPGEISPPPVPLLSESRRTVPGALPGVESAAVGDLDGDGDLDVLVGQFVNSSSPRADSIHYFIGGATGLEQVARTLPSTPGLDAVAIADVDGDGCNDVIGAGDHGVGLVHRGSNGSFDTGQDLPQIGYGSPASRPAPVVPRDCQHPGAAPFLVGTPGADVLVGTAGRDVLSGRAGADCLFGLSGDDRLRGGSGADALAGGSGNDRLNGDAGDDKLTGVNGNDTISPGAGKDRVTAGGGNDTVSARRRTRHDRLRRRP